MRSLLVLAGVARRGASPACGARRARAAARRAPRGPTRVTFPRRARRVLHGLASQDGAVVPERGRHCRTTSTRRSSRTTRSSTAPCGCRRARASRTRTTARFELPVGHGDHQVASASRPTSAHAERPGEVGRDARAACARPAGWKGTSYVWDDAQTGRDDRSPAARSSTSRSSTRTARRRRRTTSSRARPSARSATPNDGRHDRRSARGPTQLNRDLRLRRRHRERARPLGEASASSRARPRPPRRPKLPVFDDPSTGNVDGPRARLPPGQLLVLPRRQTARRARRASSSARPRRDPYALGVCKPPVAAGKAAQGQKYDVVPGHPEPSILIVPHDRPPPPSVAMPELGRSLEHVEAVDVITQWIAAMPGGCP